MGGRAQPAEPDADDDDPSAKVTRSLREWLAALDTDEEPEAQGADGIRRRLVGLVHKLKAIRGYDLHSCQLDALEAALTGSDLLVRMGTGWGKTLAYLLYVLARSSRRRCPASGTPTLSSAHGQPDCGSPTTAARRQARTQRGGINDPRQLKRLGKEFRSRWYCTFQHYFFVLFCQNDRGHDMMRLMMAAPVTL